MRFKLDENLPVEAAQLLIDAGHDALTLLDQRMRGHGDPLVAKVCRDEQRTLVTLDLDFADIRLYPPQDYVGIVVLRLRLQDRNSVLGAVGRLLPAFASELRPPLPHRQSPHP